MGAMWLSLLTSLACGLMHINEGSPILKELTNPGLEQDPPLTIDDKEKKPAEEEAPKGGKLRNMLPSGKTLADVAMLGLAGAATSATTDSPFQGAVAMGAGAVAQKTAAHLARTMLPDDYKTAGENASKLMTPVGTVLAGTGITAVMQGQPKEQGHDDHDH